MQGKWINLYEEKQACKNLSEPDIIMQIATSNKPWSVTIGLIGEGQEIYSGEEGGLKLWNTAIAGKNIIVHSRHKLTFLLTPPIMKCIHIYT